MAEFFLTSAVIFVVMVAWLYVQDRYRQFAQRHPELGPYRNEGGCDGSCSCQQGSCPAPGQGRQDSVAAIDLITPAHSKRTLRRQTQ